MRRVIDASDLGSTAVDAETALAFHRDMVRARRFDDRALALQRRGWMSSYPPFRGQEASQVGAAHAMTERDWLVPTYRANALQIALGVPPSDLLLFRRGVGEYHSGHARRVFPQAISIASQIPHAVGIGVAADYRGDDCAVVCYLGDGATSEGDFHEGLNFAGVLGAPVVFLCENNGWAISTPRARQTGSDTIAQKAEAYGIDGVRVDGNDPIAVHETVASALRKARAGDPVLVESLTYRQGAHTTSDDPSRYRGEESLPAWRTADPLERYGEYLREQGVLDDDRAAAIESAADEELAAAVETAEATTPEAGDVFEHVYASSTPRLDTQRARLLRREGGRSDGSRTPDS